MCLYVQECMNVCVFMHNHHAYLKPKCTSDTKQSVLYKQVQVCLCARGSIVHYLTLDCMQHIW